MKITLSMSMSLNGIVTRPDGNEDFLSYEHWSVFVRMAEKHECFIIGRKTYVAVKEWGKEYDWAKISALCVIVSKTLKQPMKGRYLVVRSPREAVKKLSSLGYKKALLGGGPTLNAAFARAKLINEVTFAIEPILIGAGKPTIAPRFPDLPLQLISVKKKNKLLILHYRVR
jgi:riboflavin biosynthesis pyrimidine reductase